MVATSARLLRLLALLQARRFWTGAELAERLEVTERSVRRDVDRLRSLGYPVDATSGVAGGYRLGAGAVLPPLLLEDDEALAIVLGLRSAVVSTITGIEDAALRALAKLERILPQRLERRVSALHASVVTLPLPGHEVPAARLTALAHACSDQELADFAYTDRATRSSRRSVEPHGLVRSGSRFYLVAFDRDRDAFRTFRVDRITDPVRSGGRFSRRPIPGGDLAAYVSRAVASDAYTFQARVVLHAPIAEVAPRISPLAGRLTRLDATRCRLETGASSLGMLALYIANLGVDFEIEEPEELIEHARAVAARLKRAASASTSRPRTRPR